MVSDYARPNSTLMNTVISTTIGERDKWYAQTTVLHGLFGTADVVAIICSYLEDRKPVGLRRIAPCDEWHAFLRSALGDDVKKHDGISINAAPIKQPDSLPHFFACVGPDFQLVGIVDVTLPSARSIRVRLLDQDIMTRIAHQVFDQDIVYFEGLAEEAPSANEFFIRNMPENDAPGPWRSVASLNDEMREGYSTEDEMADNRNLYDEPDSMGHFVLRPTMRALRFG